jgi:hypothetical protein
LTQKRLIFDKNLTMEDNTESPFIRVVKELKRERDYQGHICATKGFPDEPTIEGEIIMLKTYVDKVMPLWTKKQNDKEVVLSEIRKIAGIAIRCLENHGCPKRDYFSSYIKNTNE